MRQQRATERMGRRTYGGWWARLYYTAAASYWGVQSTAV